MKKFVTLIMAFSLVGFFGCIDNSTNSPDDDDNAAAGISGTITRDTTWSKLGKEILIDDDLIINADVIWDRKILVAIKDGASVKINGAGSLTIKEGVRIKAGTGCYFEVGYTSAGALIVTGSDSLPVTFTKNTGVQNWGYDSDNGGGILLHSNTTSLTSFEYCNVEYATHGIYVDGISPVIKNCKIRNNAGLGIIFSGNAAPKDSASFTGNVFAGNGGYPIAIGAEGVTKLAGETVFTTNGKQGIEVATGDVTQSGTWRKHSVPYFITGPIHIGKPTSGVIITFAPGVVCKLDVDSYFEIGYVDPATVIANGTDSSRIVFTTSTPGSYWGYKSGGTEGGLWIGVKSTANTAFSYCTIENATAGIYCREAKIAVSSSLIRKCELSGIKFDGLGGPKDSASFVNNTITGNGEYAIEISSSQLGALSGTGSIAGNTLGGIYVNGDNIKTASNIWKKHDAPYIIADQVDIGAATGASVTIRPGAEFLMATDAYIQIGYTDPGTLIAEGTATDYIKFTSAVSGIAWGYDGGGTEGGFWIGEKGTSNISFRYCDIGFATTGIYVRKASVSIKDCTIHDCSVNGITLDQNAPQTNISGITYTNNAGGDLVVVP